MAQLQERRYADKYRALGQPIYLIGVEFSKDDTQLWRRLTSSEHEAGAGWL